MKLRASGQPVGGGPALEDYLETVMADERVERMRVIFVNSRQRILADETMWTGTIDSVPMYAREIVRRALIVDAAGMVVVHNHPSGDPMPSARDIEATGELMRAAMAVGVVLHDHLIVGSDGRFSLRRAGLM
ncbi:JAB domain-containing protein [Sphingosinicellaceae bacterium]|nr:JAB domain-containing protein [Sphingosinicellaceae bacterium]